MPHPRQGGGQPDLRIKAVVDDGSGRADRRAEQTVTEMLVGITLAESLKEAKEAMNPEIVEEKIKDGCWASPSRCAGTSPATSTA